MKQYWKVGVCLGYAGVVGWWHFRTTLGWWLLGIGLAGVLLVADRLLYVWWLKPFEQLSIQIQYWWQRRDVLTVARLLRERGHEQSKLVLMSMGFALVWPALTIYVFTSTGSVTAMGIVMGLGLYLTSELIAGLRNVEQLKMRFCWQIKRPVTDREVRVIASVFVGFFALMTIGLLIQ